DLVAMVALDLDRALLDRATGPAMTLEIACHGGEVGPAQAAYDRDDPAAAAALLAEDPNDAVVRELRLLTPLRGVAAAVASVGRVHQPALGHGSDGSAAHRLDCAARSKKASAGAAPDDDR